MPSGKGTISACLVVRNEEAVIERCLKSIALQVDEIIVVHDGPCNDATIEIARKYSDKVFVKEYAGMMEAHLVYAFSQASCEWLLRIDADEFLDSDSFIKIKQFIRSREVDALILKWEMWDGKNVINIPGAQKMCFMRREHFHYCGIPHENGTVDGKVKKINVFLHHRPAYNNIAWSSFLRKANKWVPIHAKYFFPELVAYNCFNTTAEAWIQYAKRIRLHASFFVLYYPLKIFIAQLRNGLGTSLVGWNLAVQQYVYYFRLFITVRKIQKLKNK